MTPKGLLRLKQASSMLEELSGGSFQPVIDDPRAHHDEVERLVVCSGKVYYDIAGHDLHEAARSVAVTRLEQLYPFPVEAVEALLGRYPRLREVVWAQEEPQNMGPWRSIRHRLEETVRASSAESLRYVGRTWKASPSEGYPTAHQVEQDRIVRTALGVTS
jgi:2-oxoglutarate dehydrogenase E1 component